MSTCPNCFDNCAGNVLSDKCVKYTGDEDDLLSICTGDSLYQVLTSLITAYNNTTDASKINLSSVGAGCTFFTNELAGKPLSVQNVITALVSAVCCLKDSVTTLQGEVSPPVSFDTECLDVAADATIAEILQAAFIKICSLNTSVTNISNDYVKASQVCTLVSQCIANSASTQEHTKMPKYVALPYHGPMSAFDSTGKGIASAGYDKVYLCIGQTVNGFVIPDYRGRSPLGANVNIPSSGMDGTVNPALPANAGYGVSVNGKKGEYSHTLTVNESASHSHTITDPGHTHIYQGLNKGAGDGSDVIGSEAGTLSKATISAKTNITINSAGGNQPHNTLHPVVGANFIMYIP